MILQDSNYPNSQGLNSDFIVFIGKIRKYFYIRNNMYIIKTNLKKQTNVSISKTLLV